MDIVLKINTAYYDKGQLVKDRFRILIRYIKGNFFIDIVTSFTLVLNEIIVY